MAGRMAKQKELNALQRHLSNNKNLYGWGSAAAGVTAAGAGLATQVATDPQEALLLSILLGGTTVGLTNVAEIDALQSYIAEANMNGYYSPEERLMMGIGMDEPVRKSGVTVPRYLRGR